MTKKPHSPTHSVGKRAPTDVDGNPFQNEILLDCDGNGSSVRVLVVDDFEPFRQFVCSTLGEGPAFQVIGQASDGSEAIHKAAELKPDLLVLDIGLPTVNGLEAAREILRLSPRSKIIFVSQESSAAIVREALSLGGLGYVHKAYADELLSAVHAVCKGSQYLSNELAKRFAAEPGIARRTLVDDQ
jgi:DNA-binding NarL/FixJ family response regulator